jgi:hypothetical protein
VRNHRQPIDPRPRLSPASDVLLERGQSGRRTRLWRRSTDTAPRVWACSS